MYVAAAVISFVRLFTLGNLCVQSFQIPRHRLSRSQVPLMSTSFAAQPLSTNRKQGVWSKVESAAVAAGSGMGAFEGDLNTMSPYSDEQYSRYFPPDRKWSSVEQVVGLDKGLASYDRERMLAFFLQRPWVMTSRALTYALAFQRVLAVWNEGGDNTGEVLRSELSALGPVAVKLGQTLSQRPDIIPEEVCDSLKALQTTNTPFSSIEAFQVLSDSLNNKGPIDATGRLPLPVGCSPDMQPLFREVSPEPIASASLGQVYKGVTIDGREVAIKIQRPTALRQCLLDASIIMAALKVIENTNFWNGDLIEVFDGVAEGVVQELDFRWEARNARTFADSLTFLGYVRVPQALPEYTVGPNVLVTEWIHGRHLGDLTRDEGLRMTSMAVEAITAGLVLTGQVHADPHEGNVMLDNDGKLVFLDFGLMSEVRPDIMEAFASGIQCVLSKDYKGLVKAFMDTGFVGTPLEHRELTTDEWGVGDPTRLERELREAMEAAEGGQSRFGALSTVLYELGNYWCMYTPPYVILLIRTFLTLEGIAERVDPSFNIYEMALPWAVQRALTPSTGRGRNTLRSLLLTGDNRFQWARVEDYLEQVAADKKIEGGMSAEQLQQKDRGMEEESVPAAAVVASSSMASLNSTGTAPLVDQKDEFSSISGTRDNSAATPLRSLKEVLGGGSEGSTLRRIIRDLDSTSLLLTVSCYHCIFSVVSIVCTLKLSFFLTQNHCALFQLASKEARPARRLAVESLVPVISDAVRTKRRDVRRSIGRVLSRRAAKVDSKTVSVVSTPNWPTSEESEHISMMRQRRAARVGRILAKSHLKRQVNEGWRGALAMLAISFVTTRVVVAAAARAFLRSRAVQSVLALTFVGAIARKAREWKTMTDETPSEAKIA